MSVYVNVRRIPNSRLCPLYPWVSSFNKQPEHTMVYDKQLRLYNGTTRSNSLRRRYEEVVPHHIYLYIQYTIISKDPFFCCYQWNFLAIIPSFSFITVLIDFLTIRKYRKKDINKIVRTPWKIVQKIRAFFLISQTTATIYRLVFRLSLHMFEYLNSFSVCSFFIY